MMLTVPRLLIAALLAGQWPAQAAQPTTSLGALKLSQLEQRLSAIDTELSSLAPISLRNSVGGVGYRSASHKSPEHIEWLRIELGDEFPIDQVVLVPTLGRDALKGLQADGFPLEFQVFAGTADTTNLVASFTRDDKLLPRIAPLAIQFNPILASWVRLECSHLSKRNWTGQNHGLLLSEMMVFNGGMNVALQKQVRTSSNQGNRGGYHKRFLVDGFHPYLMDAVLGEGSASRAFTIESDQKSPTLTIDLGASFPVNQINLHALGLGHTLPVPVLEGYAIPQRFHVSGANRPDFADEALLFEYVRESIYDAGPVIRRNIPETRCRYVRITAIDFESDNIFGKKTQRIGFTEIEILSNSQNRALDRPVTASSNILRTERMINRMTDGNNIYGKILPLREWMDQLARRHDLESERPRVMTELTNRYAKQKTNLKWASWLIALLLAGSVILALIEKVLRQRAIYKTRERIAANLHDELGANLHAIALLGDSAKKVVDQKKATENWPELIEIIEDVRELTEETGSTARFCTNMLEADDLYQNVIKEMQRTADRLLADLEHTFSVSQEENLQGLKPRRRIDLILFYKESLINILRHSDASTVLTQISTQKKLITLSISDNGIGTEGKVPPSLKRRAKLLGGSLTAEDLPNGGAKIALRFRARRGLALKASPQTRT